MDERGLDILHSSTQIIIAPGYKFHIVKMMVTNFHQPQSTLLLLVSAFVNGNWRSIYDYALENDFRFLSYGDSSLLAGPTPIPSTRASEVFGRSTECASVPREGSALQCDARTGSGMFCMVCIILFVCHLFSL